MNQITGYSKQYQYDYASSEAMSYRLKNSSLHDVNCTFTMIEIFNNGNEKRSVFFRGNIFHPNN